ncbi:ParB N-terminal domain-containing protein [Puniceicoccus vermicola]|uniref:ParB N-terminal domain-containing protein n=1 Tax=Puniceicoccus vermicola TaxID=388746 RepID=A0A7X1B0J3_9BACT|nr:ParB N-terminal domain-containing protein [Puniceicoccus vermicola]MBC2603398.1 ParB N-terminal domain-containing protein [Puniceicoccus vermicola]
MQVTDLQLKQIDIYGGTQARVATNDEAISAYAEAMEEGAQFPPVITFYDGSKFWLADGFHRYLAAQRNEYDSISAEVREGSRTDALRHSLGANATNGIYRSNADKRNATEIALEEWPEMSNSVIAELCKVSPDLVRRCRNQMEKEDRIESQRQVTGKDGKQYPSAIEREPRGGSQRVENDGSQSGSGGGGGGGGAPKGKGEAMAPGGASMEIEADAKKMIREGEINHAELDKIFSATAIDYAETALNILNRMKRDDPKRPDAVARIERWLAKEKAGVA